MPRISVKVAVFSILIALAGVLLSRRSDSGNTGQNSRPRFTAPTREGNGSGVEIRGNTITTPSKNVSGGMSRFDSLKRDIKNQTADLSVYDALVWVDSIENINDYIVAIREIIASRGHKSPDDVIRWYAKKLDAGAPEREISDLVGKLSGSGDYITKDQLRHFSSDKAFGSGFFTGLAYNHPAKVGELLAVVAENPKRDLFASSASVGLAETGRFDDATRIAITIDEPKSRAAALGAVAFEMSLETPEKAVEWARAFTADDGEPVGDIASRIVSAWYSHNSLAASQWVESLPEGAAKDGAICSLATSLVRRDPGKARIWAASIGDPEIRERTIAMVNRASE